MCGISIILDPRHPTRLIERLIAMHAVIRHRGPDGEGFLAADENGGVACSAVPNTLRSTGAPRVGFAFRRLKICDLSELADQPMGSADRKIWGRLQRRDLQFPRASRRT